MSAAENAMIQEAFDQGTKVAQIFSGIFFTGVALWLTVSNGTNLAFVQKAALEKRLTVCCYLNVYIGMFSAFFNIFQLTNVDDVVLPEVDNFILDLSRPIEWICTCPLMQLSLVLMGGSKIPEYRRYMMPALSVTILTLGTCGAFFGAGNLIIKIACFVCGLSVFCVMSYFNRQQIIEYSGGAEGVLQGDSEFRKATVLLIVTWAPFPLWYCLSPEGFGFITNILLVQVGWAFLNVVSKFSFIFYIQRIKDMYCNRLKTKRELFSSHGQATSKGHGVVPQAYEDFTGVTHVASVTSGHDHGEATRKKGQLSAVVVETMNFLGQAQHTDRFLKLLEQANVNCVSQVADLTKEECADLHVPFDLVSAVQRRLRVWSLEMVDDTELCLDQGEEYYLKKGSDNPRGRAPPGMVPGMVYWPEQAEDTTAKVTEIHEILRNKFGGGDEATSDSKSTADERMGSKVDEAVDAMSSKLRSFETRMDEKFNDFVASAQHVNFRVTTSIEQALAAFTAQVQAPNGAADTAGRVPSSDHAVEALCGSVAQVCKQVQSLAAKVDALQASQAKSFAGSEQCWLLRSGELETAMMCRFEEQEMVHKRRFDELLRAMPVKRIEEVASQVQRVGEEAEKLSSALMAELQSSAGKVTQRMESLHATTGRQVVDADAHVQRCFEDAASRMAVAVDSLDQGMAKRLDDAVATAAAKGAHSSAAQTDRRAEKAIEAFQTASRGEMHALSAKLLDRVEDLQSAMFLKASEREEQNMRRVEEALEIAATRNTQKTEAVGIEMKKELHGFAKRLNAKIPFM